MLYYRRRFLLALISELGGTVPPTKLEKILFLACQEAEDPPYAFVPYRYGCFSFQSFADLRAMGKTGLLENVGKNWRITESARAATSGVTESHRRVIARVTAQYGNMEHVKLIRHVYTAYPFYATKSEIAEAHLNSEELRRIDDARPRSDQTFLTTIGYEGKSVDDYFRLLVEHGIRVLCDVRKNPLSMKYGFSKSQLASSTESLGIKYVHLPELGIVSAKRQDLISRVDYDRLFAEYERTTIPRNESALWRILDLLGEYKRVALTCFEADPNMCHRTRVARALLKVKPKPLEFLEL